MDSSPGLRVLRNLTAGLLASILPSGAFAQGTGPDSPAEVKTVVRQILKAIAAYQTEYGDVPSVLPRKEQRVIPTDDITVGEPTLDPFVPNSALFDVLRAIDDASNVGHGNNPRRIVFIEAPGGDIALSKAGFGQAADNSPQKRGCFFDPWGHEFRIRIDYDRSGTIETPSGKLLKGQAIVWSVGPDGKSGTKDDINSWE